MRLRKKAAVSAETARAMGRSAASITVTGRPRAAPTPANSSPMKPAPTMAMAPRRLEGRLQRVGVGEAAQLVHARARSAPGTGSGRLRAPVARTRWS